MCLLPSSDGKRIKALLDTGKCLLKPHKSSAEVPQGCLEKKKKKDSAQRGTGKVWEGEGRGHSYTFYYGRRKAESQNDTAEEKHQRRRGLSLALLLSGNLELCWKELLEHSTAREQQVLTFSVHYFA